MRKLAGFTLVEVLVVVAIIGILSAVLYGSFDDAREEARNKALQSELKEMQLAFELYRAQYSEYPPVNTTSGTCSDTSGDPHTAENTNTVACDDYVYAQGIVPEFMIEVPESRDSNNPNCEIIYEVDASGGWYKLTASQCLEGAEAADDGIGEDEEFSLCPSSCSSGNCNGEAYDETGAAFYESMAVYSAGGECQ